MKHLAPFLPPLIYTKTLMVVGMMLIVTKLSGNLQWPWAVVFLPFYAAHLAYALLTLGVLAWLRIDNWLQIRWSARYYDRLKRQQVQDGFDYLRNDPDMGYYDSTGLPGFLRESHDVRPTVEPLLHEQSK